jgi:ribosomal protein L35
MAVDDEDQGGNHTTEAGRSKPAAPSMKERSAAKKRAEKAVGAVLAGGVAEGRHIYHTDTPTDCAQLVSHTRLAQADRQAG